VFYAPDGIEVFQMLNRNFTQHNEEAKAVWEAYLAGHPIRVPVLLGTSARYYLYDNAVNTKGKITFQEYSEDPQVMMEVQLRAADERAHTVALCCDDQAGPPEFYTVGVDLLRYFDAAFFGAKIEYREGQMPDTVPLLAGERKNMLFDHGLPDPLTGGIFAHAHHLHEAMEHRIHAGFTYRGKPIKLAPFGIGHDGPLTVATSLRGQELYLDFYNDPDYVHQLLDFIVEGTVARIKAHLRFFGLPELSDAWGCPELARADRIEFADDAMQMISTDMLREFLLPAYKKLKRQLTNAEKIGIHLCGDATRHFKLLRDELGVYSFDTGFPIDFAWVRHELGPQVQILGGPQVPLLLRGTPEEVIAETGRILKSGIMVGGRFIMRDANALAPSTPLPNLVALYQATKELGVY
jgi:uroporphyrinogen-III decarboxylase